MKIIIIHLKIGDTTMKKFKVYQLPVKHNAKFMRLSFVKEHNIMPKLEDYKLVYEGEFEPQGEYSEPDQLYMKFQGEKPEGYTGHSISMSDVVEIDGKYYYCDSYGWEEVDFEEPKTKKAYIVKAYKSVTYIAKYNTREEALAKANELNDDYYQHKIWNVEEIEDETEEDEEAKMIDLEENGNRCAGETPEMKVRIAEARRMKRYQELKSKHPDAILLFRCGDFYETYYGDAITAAKVLGITLTHRQGFKKGHEIAGFPHHALDIYLPKLIRAGLKVAIVDE